MGPAGTGKSQIAYAVARILKLPWTTLDMSSINDPEQLTGSSRVYANANQVSLWMHLPWQENQIWYSSLMSWIKQHPEKEMAIRRMSFDITDNLGFTDNYMECMIPTVGVYPIATANEKTRSVHR